MTVNAVECLTCGDIIYSRAHHDMHYCSCKNVFVDGGFQYFRWGAKDFHKASTCSIEIPYTEEELFNDWDKWEDKYGVILPEDKLS